MTSIQKRYCVLLFLVSFLCVSFSSSVQTVNQSAVNSVLSEGNWYKIKIPRTPEGVSTGVYKLTYDDLKNKIGLENPADVKIYGYGGWILDEDFSKPYHNDLPRVSIWMSNTPENFGKNDYILFYARGDIKWEYNNQTKEFEQTQNPYSFDTYYFVTESPEAPVLMDTQPSLSQGTDVVTTFNDYVLHEKEVKNIGQSGRVFYGENFASKTSQEFTLKTEGATSDPAILRYNFAYYVTFPNGQNLSVNFNNVKDTTAYTMPIRRADSITFTFAREIDLPFLVNNLKGENKVNLSYNRKYGTDKNLYLNYLRLNYKRILKPYGSVTLFRNADINSDNVTYQISEANNSMMVLDVTDNTIVKKVEAQLSGSTLSFSASNTTLREYALVDLAQSDKIPTPILSDRNDPKVGSVKKQNLHAESGYDMVIIVQPHLQSFAKDLADLHQEDSELKTLIVNPEDIYNEFSSGKPDITAFRRFMKMLYDKGVGSDNRVQHLLLFGGGTYDNRLQDDNWTEAERKSMLLTYQSENSLYELSSYTTDDYLGFLDNTSGKRLANDELNISVGRLPARDEADARNVVAKIRSYIKNEDKGIWQNDILYVADDLLGSRDSNNERWFVEDADSLANYTNRYYPNFMTNKLYEDSFERSIQANGARYPGATRALLENIEMGTLVLNFIGHGTTRSWTHENLLTYSDIQSLNNTRLGLWITATCDFSRFDADERSGGELALMKRTGGAVALYSTVRTVYIFNNTLMNNSLTKYLLEKDEDGKPLRIGEIMRRAKLDPDMRGDENKLKFALLGDPALRLKFPDNTYTVEVAEVNGIDTSEELVNIEALSNMSIVGYIKDKDGNIATGFNGVLESVIFDSEQELKTRGYTRSGNPDPDRGLEYKAYPNTLFFGKVQVVNGVFEINFTAPRDILYANGRGKMSFFAYDPNGKDEAQGSFFNYTVGGTDINAPEESNLPVIEEMYLNSKNFQSGGYVNSTPLFHAIVSDDTGINLSNSIGHRITLTIDGNTQYDLTNYFVNEGNSSKRGEVSFRIPELALGNHYLEFRVWDVFNNSTSEMLDFVVSNDVGGATYSFDIWGNPARDMTKFVFRTESPSTDVLIKMSVYTLSGKMIWIQEIDGDADNLTEYILDWDLNANGIGRIPAGVYICRADIIVDGKSSFVKTQKMIVAGN